MKTRQQTIWRIRLEFSCFFPSPGESVVSEQTDEVEASEGWTARGRSEGERTGACEKGDFAAFWVFGHRRTPPQGGLTD